MILICLLHLPYMPLLLRHFFCYSQKPEEKGTCWLLHLRFQTTTGKRQEGKRQVLLFPLFNQVIDFTILVQKVLELQLSHTGKLIKVTTWVYFADICCLDRCISCQWRKKKSSLKRNSTIWGSWPLNILWKSLYC